MLHSSFELLHFLHLADLVLHQLPYMGLQFPPPLRRVPMLLLLLRPTPPLRRVPTLLLLLRLRAALLLSPLLHAHHHRLLLL